MFQMPRWDSSTDYGFPAFVEQCDAVVMGRTTFEPALASRPLAVAGQAGRCVLTSSPLPDETPADVIVPDGGVSALVARIRATELAADVHLVGGPRTIQAFQEIGALDRLEAVGYADLLGDEGYR